MLKDVLIISLMIFILGLTVMVRIYIAKAAEQKKEIINMKGDYESTLKLINQQINDIKCIRKTQ